LNFELWGKMDAEELRLVELEPEYEAAFWEFLDALKAEGDAERWLFEFEYKGEGCAEAAEKLKGWKTGKGLPQDWVPASTLFLMRGGKFIGRVSIRHKLNDFLLRIGGHIGYYIRSDERGKGYGSRILAMALEEARRLGLMRVLVTCDEGNVASRKIIEKNGGLLENVEPTKDGPLKRRYWIAL
jgi:predicted acetyltransferase